MIKVISKNKEKTQYCYLVKSAEGYILNAIRRSVISLVPTMAIENVEIRKNSSLLYDEVLAHRLGLIPLTTDLKHYEMIQKPEDEESLKCTVKFTIKVKGPKTVYAKDLKSADPAVVPVYPEMPIVKLVKNQEIALEATAILGIGRVHMKWSPGIVYFKNKPIVQIKGNIDTEKLKSVLPEDSPLKISGSRVSVDDNKLYTTNYLDAFVGESVVPGINVSIAEDEYVFFVESFGQLSPKDMIGASVDVLKKKLDEINTIISKD